MKQLRKVISTLVGLPLEIPLNFIERSPIHYIEVFSMSSITSNKQSNRQAFNIDAGFADAALRHCVEYLLQTPFQVVCSFILA